MIGNEPYTDFLTGETKMLDAPFPKEMMPCIAKFFDEEERRKPGADFYPDVFHSEYFFPLQRPREMAEMIRTARRISPKVVFEIGADKGGGLYHWCKCLPSVQRVIACEIRGLPYSSYFEKAFPHIEFLWIVASSFAPSVASAVQSWLRDDRIDCLFIDGDKLNFATDFDTYLPMMSLGGIVFMHDIQDSPPQDDYRRVIARGYRHEEIINIEDADEATKRESMKIPPANQHEGWLRHWYGRSCGVGVIYLDNLNMLSNPSLTPPKVKL